MAVFLNHQQYWARGFEEKLAGPGWIETPHRQDGPHLFVLYMFVLPSAVIVPLGRVVKYQGAFLYLCFWENFVVFLFVGRIRK